MFKTLLYLIPLASLLNMVNPLNWHTNFEAASEIAATEQRPIFMLFTGSDWCPNCKQLEKEVLGTAEFQQFAQQNLVLLEVDFPRKKQAISKDQRTHNEELAAQFNPKGIFPYIVLTDGKQTISAQNYKGQTAEAFLKDLQQKLKD